MWTRSLRILIGHWSVPSRVTPPPYKLNRSPAVPTGPMVGAREGRYSEACDTVRCRGTGGPIRP